MNMLDQLAHQFTLPILAALLATGCAGVAPTAAPADTRNKEETARPAAPPVTPRPAVAPTDRNAQSRTPAARSTEAAPPPAASIAPILPPPDVRIVLTTAQAALSARDLRDLEDVAERAKRRKRVVLFIESYSSWRGSRALNMALAQQRADEIKEILVKFGVPVGRIRTTAYGEERKGLSAAQHPRIDVRVIEPSS